MDANSRLTEMLELSDKDFKAAIVKMLQRAIRNTFQTPFPPTKSSQPKDSREKLDFIKHFEKLLSISVAMKINSKFYFN